MSKDLHIFTNGIDPFVFMVEGVTVHVHSGVPEPTLVSDPPAAGDTTATEPRPKRTPLPPPMAFRATDRASSFDEWIHRYGEEYDGGDGTDIVIHLHGAPEDATDLNELLDGLEHSEEHQITVAYEARPDSGRW